MLTTSIQEISVVSLPYRKLLYDILLKQLKFKDFLVEVVVQKRQFHATMMR